MDLTAVSSVKRQLRLTSIGGARIIFAALAPDLVALGECGERVADRHLARLVAFEIHSLQNLAAGQAISAANKIEKSLAARTARCLALRLHAAATTRFAGLRRLVCIEGLEFAV